ncbi:hypothetical protein TIFTF001_016161 [Ficus carica]|uniref:FAD-binding PCMH-type domain-containing protein n=1 Tax=Ficus carica TaxID=3494 RepID=A0AA88A714_FICCA|nr:hypothetical protein TIFTF001_016161 [Ficus carica]
MVLGGCGACVVMLSKYDPVHDKVEDFTVSSCLTLLCSIHGCAITTSEGIGNSKDGFHPIHERIAAFHASQCGFCTPGMCVAIFSALVNAEKTSKLDPPAGFSKLTVCEAEKAIAGNLCRCTGYRSIADASKSFAADVDIEDLGFNSFWKKEDSKESKIDNLPAYNRNKEVCTFPEFLKREIKDGLSMDSKISCWHSPFNVEELKDLLKALDSGKGTETKLVVGNTGVGYYKELGRYERYINLNYMPELSIFRKDSIGFQIGAAVAISKVIEALNEENHVSQQGNAVVLFETYRAAPRPLGNALAYLNAAFLAQISPYDTSDGITINHCRLAFGAYGTKHAIRARRVEEFLTGKVPSVEVLYEATKLLRSTIHPKDGTANSAYRSSLAVAFLFEFFSPFIDGTAETTDGSDKNKSKLFSKASIIGENQDPICQDKIPTLLSSGKQVIKLSKEYYPVGKPITKSGAALHASGEAVYVDDIPSPYACLYGAFIYSTEPFARVKSIKFETKEQPEGVFEVITFRDIPEAGENVGSKHIFGTEPLFGDDITQCAGQRLALVVADSQKHADVAAKLAVVDYGVEDLEPPILTVEEAVRRSSFFDVPPFLNPKQKNEHRRRKLRKHC